VELSGFPAEEVEFDRAGRLAGDRGAAVRELAADGATTDLVVLSHGWNNDHLTARLLYAALAASMRSVSDRVPGLADRRIAFACVLWPSRKFAGLAGLGERLDLLRELLPEQKLTIDAAADLVPALAARATARTAFAAALLSVAARGADDREDASAQLFSLPGATVMNRLAEPASGFADAAKHLLDYLSYYEMKARAGVVGERGLAPLLGTFPRPGPRVHLAGHSFGGRLVTAAAKARPPASLSTLTLLQAAFSHHGFAADWDDGDAGPQPGAFRDVLDRRVVTGPILVTHTVNDLAVGVAYEIASRIAGQKASLGGAVSVYGGIGSNGAQRTDEAVKAELLPVGEIYTWQPGVPHNLRADRFVRGHTDVCGPEIAHALLSAIAAS
jgi:hypothetical protein